MFVTVALSKYYGTATRLCLIVIEYRMAVYQCSPDPGGQGI